MRPKVLVMAGGTASGKTTLARRLVAALGDQVLLLTHDRYYLDQPDPSVADFDHPDALETSLLVENLDDLLAGRSADLPVYDFPTHRRQPEVERVAPRPLVLVEGILVLSDPELKRRADLTVFVEAAADVRLARRVRRDAAKRGRTVPMILDRYLSMVRPAHLEFIEPCRKHADLVLDGEGSIEAAAAALEDAARRLLV